MIYLLHEAGWTKWHNDTWFDNGPCHFRAHEKTDVFPNDLSLLFVAQLASDKKKTSEKNQSSITGLEDFDAPARPCRYRNTSVNVCPVEIKLARYLGRQVRRKAPCHLLNLRTCPVIWEELDITSIQSGDILN